MAERATVYDFTTRRKIEPTPEHPVVEGQVATDPTLPVSLRPATPPTPGVSKAVLLRAACGTVAQAWSDNTPVELHGWSPEANAARRHALWVLTKFVTLDVPFATVRGGCLAVVAWWHWVHQTQRRREALLDGRFAAQAKDITEKSTARAKQSAIGAAVGAVAVLIFLHRATTELELYAAAALFLALFARGYQWKRPRKPEGARVATFLGGDIYGLQRALIAAGLMKDEQAPELVVRVVPHPVGKGVQGVVQLPRGLSVGKVIKAKAAVSSGLGCDSDFLVLWKEGADDTLGFWIPVGDPFSGNTRRLPLLDEARWNAWRPAPFGFTARDQDVDLLLMYSNMLIGAKPGAGKSFAARCAAAPYVLDPTVPVYVANGKPDGAWLPTKDFAVRYICGRSDEMALQVLDMLREVQTEMDRRFAEHLGTSSKVTEATGVPPMLVIVDELQNYTTNGLETKELLRGKKATVGQHIDALLVDIAKNGRAAGVILLLVTQRPSDESLSTELRAQLGTRFALRCMDYQTSNMILGNVSKLKIDASQIQAAHRGLGILALDMEEGVANDEIGDYPKVRTYLVEDDDWAAMCSRGYALRQVEGTLPSVPDVFEDEGDVEPTPMPQAEVPDLLESVFDLAHDLDDEDRVPTTEIVDRFEPSSNTKVVGRQFRRWGAPTGRDKVGSGWTPSGPRVGDVRAAVARIRDGGDVEILSGTVS